MLRNRIIALVLLKNDLVVQSVGFEKYYPIGRLDIVLEFLESWDVDEVIILDVDASRNKKTINFELIKNASRKIFIPLAIGGGITSNNDVELALHSGADKVVINSAFYNDIEFIKNAVFNFGSQCIVASGDLRLISGNYFTFTANGKNKELPVLEWISEIVKCNIGEIFINSIDHDGMKCGYDVNLIKLVKNKTKVPVIAAGGAGNPMHINQLLNQVECAAAVGNILYHSEHSTSVIKSFLKVENQNIRSSYFINYEKFQFDRNGLPVFIEHKSLFN
jgi:cyclase